MSWLLAFFEYCLQVPANRLGYGQFTAAQLKIIQEVITLLVFVAFAWLYLGERLLERGDRVRAHTGRRDRGESAGVDRT